MKLEPQRNPNLDVLLKQLRSCLSRWQQRRDDGNTVVSSMLGSDWPDPVLRSEPNPVI